MMVALQEEHDIGMHTPGSIRLIEKGNEARLLEAQHHVALAALYDDPEFPTRMIDVDEVRD